MMYFEAYCPEGPGSNPACIYEVVLEIYCRLRAVCNYVKLVWWFESKTQLTIVQLAKTANTIYTLVGSISRK